jgi:hypothetical protein
LYDFTILEMGYLQRGFLIYLTQNIVGNNMEYGISHFILTYLWYQGRSNFQTMWGATNFKIKNKHSCTEKSPYKYNVLLPSHVCRK